MLSERFLRRLDAAFPEFYDRVDAQAREDAQRLLREAGGDAQKALVRARFEGAGRVWWPYVKGTVGRDRAAMEAFTRLVLTIDHVVGWQPAGMEAARDHVVAVLRESLDIERLQRLVGRREKDEAKAAAAGAGVAASLTALMAPISAFRSARKWIRFVPPPLRVTLAAVVVAAVLSVPIVAGYSAGQHAERSARDFGRPGSASKERSKTPLKGQDPRIRP